MRAYQETGLRDAPKGYHPVPGLPLQPAVISAFVAYPSRRESSWPGLEPFRCATVREDAARSRNPRVSPLFVEGYDEQFAYDRNDHSGIPQSAHQLTDVHGTRQSPVNIHAGRRGNAVSRKRCEFGETLTERVTLPRQHRAKV